MELGPLVLVFCGPMTETTPVEAYKVGVPAKNEPEWTINGGVPELKRQLDLNDSLPQIDGTILFREDFLNQPQTQDAVNYLRSRWGQTP